MEHTSNMNNSVDIGLTAAPVFVSTRAEVKSGFPLPSTTVEQNTEKGSTNSKKRNTELFLQSMRTKWDCLECESDAIEHETDAEQEAIVKECFLRWLHRYSADHLRQRHLAKKLQATATRNVNTSTSHS